MLPKTGCASCNFSGYITVNGLARRCQCLEKRIADSLCRAARIPERYESCRIGNYQLTPGPYEKSQATAMLAASAFVEHVRKDPSGGDGLLMIGTPGVGKTHLGVSILNEFLTSAGQLRCMFFDYRELLSKIRYSFNPEARVTEESVLDPVFTTDVLLIDELGSERATDWVLDTVSRILNTRYNRRRATILTTNYADLPPTESDVSRQSQRAGRAETLGDRITEPMRSRLHEMCKIIEIQGEDFRCKGLSERERLLA